MTLHWGLTRTAAALDALNERLQVCVQRLARAGDRDVRIVPAATDDDQLAELAGLNIAYDGIRINEAKLLYGLAGGRTPERHKVPLLSLRHLRAAGLIEFTEQAERNRTRSDIELSDDTRFNLCLD